MAKNYNELTGETEVKAPKLTSGEGGKITMVKDMILDELSNRINNGSNIDYIVKLSEVYRNIK